VCWAPSTPSRDAPATNESTLAALGRDGPRSKIRDGRFCFLCPHCNEMLAYVNPRNNLAHCFHCNTNLNNIDLMLTLGYDFPAAVDILERLLNEFENPRFKNSTSTSPTPS
jgi:hypothetical protein